MAKEIVVGARVLVKNNHPIPFWRGKEGVVVGFALGDFVEVSFKENIGNFKLMKKRELEVL